MVHSYYADSIPPGCSVDDASPEVSLTVSRGVWPDRDNTNVELAATGYADTYNRPLLVASEDYSAGDTLVITVVYDWKYNYDL